MNMFKYLQYLPLLIKLVNFVREAQAQFRGPGAGTAKMQWVVTNFSSVIEAAASAGLIEQKLAQTITAAAPQLVEVIVQLLKAVHGSVPPAENVPLGSSGLTTEEPGH
jgi:hypothetical protein